LRDVRFDAGGHYLATAGADGFIHLYDLRSSATTPVISVEHRSGKPIVQALAVALGPRLWATSGLNNVIRFWSYAGEDRGSIQRKGFANFRDIAFHPDGREIAALGINQVIIWPEEQFGVADAAPRLVLDLSDAKVCTSIAYNGDGTRLAVACKDSSVYIFDMRTGKRLQTITAHDAGVNQAVFSPDGDRLGTASADGTFLVAPLDFSQLHPLGRRLRDNTAATAGGSNPD
jgi:WD40 repeat protein